MIGLERGREEAFRGVIGNLSRTSGVLGHGIDAKGGAIAIS